jgi:hypothetical protein
MIPAGSSFFTGGFFFFEGVGREKGLGDLLTRPYESDRIGIYIYTSGGNHGERRYF